jgi:predicted phosphodiesterase
MGWLGHAFKAIQNTGRDMRHEHIGNLVGPILVFGGPYSNVQATNALLEQAKSRGIAGQNLICTGDVVAYCAAPCETVQAIRQSGCAVVAGNCEIQLAAGALDCGCGFEEGSTCDLLSAGWFAFANAQIQSDDRQWMAQRPDIISFDHAGARYAVIHGGISDVARFIWETSDQAVFVQEWEGVEALIGPVDHIIAGHSGIPFVRETAKGRWINAGVIGMPPHDGAPNTRFAVIEAGQVTLCNLEYDAATAAAQMQSVGLTQGYEKSLISGIWPSEDILPHDLRLYTRVSG